MGRLGRRKRIPIIRVLILGAEGVGKNSLESRFITLTYPPLYDPDLTAVSRRLLNLSPYTESGDDPSISIARRLDTPHDLFTGSLRQSLDKVPGPEARRPRSVSSTFSNLGSELDLHAQDTCSGEQDLEVDRTALAEDVSLYIPRDEQFSTSHCPHHPEDSQSYFVEITNYPALQSPKARSQFLSKGHYDAVLLVYDVGNRSSFNAITDLHAEIPLSAHRRKRSRWGRGNPLRKTRSSIFASHGGNHSACVRQAEVNSGTGEIVVSLVGNKVDLDLESDEGEEHDLEYQWHMLEKKAALQEADVEERSLVHPLYRESRLYDDQDIPLSPRSVSLSVKSASSVPVHLQGRRRDMVKGDLVRRSVFSDGGRMSSFSAGRVSLNLVPEGNEQSAPLDGEKNSIERWIERGGLEDEEPVRNFSLGDGGDDHIATDSHPHGEAHDIDGTGSDTTTTHLPPQRPRPRREVSRLEGELLSRALLLNVPIHETSAKTGENVEEVFQAVVREVLREMGFLSSYWHGTGCCCGVQPAVQGAPTDEAGNNRSSRDREVAGSEKRKKRTLSRMRRPGGSKGEKRGTSNPPVPGIVEGDGGGREVDNDKPVTDTAVFDESIEAVESTPDLSGLTIEISPPSLPQKKRRQGSALERFKKVFTRKSEVAVSDVAVA